MMKYSLDMIEMIKWHLNQIKERHPNEYNVDSILMIIGKGVEIDGDDIGLMPPKSRKHVTLHIRNIKRGEPPNHDIEGYQ